MLSRRFMCLTHFFSIIEKKWTLPRPTCEAMSYAGRASDKYVRMK